MGSVRTWENQFSSDPGASFIDRLAELRSAIRALEAEEKVLTAEIVRVYNIARIPAAESAPEPFVRATSSHILTVSFRVGWAISPTDPASDPGRESKGNAMARGFVATTPSATKAKEEGALELLAYAPVVSVK